MKYKITIFVNGVFREYEVTYNQLQNNDWSAKIADMVESVDKAQKV